ncbi:Reverse transcriptase domain [Arabidopsis thaliana x Arabidopsis arenosa]|uniref:Reverse transcriptase domain n=1 Tax=Arabidopsis thaliana x Arabidopsis arenosa TaxID=1240361 RepID=A0A8T1XGN1_9BRAS|nr:Reverse transcriptase domain [Arabidopsis thaliana x Arabidopsis arenosa]
MLKRRYWHIADIPLVVNEWSPEMIQERPNLSAMPLWVDLKGVPGHLFAHWSTRHKIGDCTKSKAVNDSIEKQKTHLVKDNIAHPAGSPGSAGELLEVVKSLMTDLDSLKALPVVVSQSKTLKIQDSVVQQGEIVEMQSIGVVEVASKERDSEEVMQGNINNLQQVSVFLLTFQKKVRLWKQDGFRGYLGCGCGRLGPGCKTQIQECKETYGDLPTRVKLAYVDLCQKQNDALTSLHQSSYATVIEAYEKWQHLASIEEQFFCQKSRVQWLHLGDQNTSFFHKVAESRAAKKAIKQLKSSNGEVLTELSAIKAEAVSYKEFLQTQPRDIEIPNVKSIANLVSFRCSAGNAGTLLQPITAEEIRKTVFSMPLNKGPGPDGFTAEFYRAAWLIIEADFVVVVQSFFLYGFMPKRINGTVLSLIPKASNPETMKDYRPIACCNLLYKLISKILARRLQQFLPDAIDFSQSAFVKGHLLL